MYVRKYIQLFSAQHAEHFPGPTFGHFVRWLRFSFTHRWEWECGWNYRYLSVPVNLCSHIVASCLPQGKTQSKGLAQCWGTARMVCSWVSLKHELAETKRERGKWGESCLKFGLCEEPSEYESTDQTWEPWWKRWPTAIKTFSFPTFNWINRHFIPTDPSILKLKERSEKQD